MMKLKVVVHRDDESGFWGEVPALPGCVSQGENMQELLANLREAIEGWLAVDIPLADAEQVEVIEIAL